MQVFKVYFKIIKSNLVLLSVYMIVFIAITVAMTLFAPKAVSTDFNESKSSVAIINNDEDSTLVKGLSAFIAQTADIKQLKNEPEVLQDALFYRKVEYIVKIPSGFTKAFMSGEKTTLEKTAVPDSTAAIYMDMLIDRFLNTSRLYVDSINGISQAVLVEKVSKDLSVEAKVNVKTKANTKSIDSSIASFFNFSAYSILAILIMGVSTYMLVMNKTDLRRRNLCSPLSQKSINLQSLSANMVFALLICLIIVICSFMLFGDQIISINGLLWLLNLLVFTFVALCLSFMLGNVIKNRSAQNAAANTISLGMCFLSGVFVPQEILGKTVKTIASFTPSYWFVKLNNEIGNTSSFNSSNIQALTSSYIIQLCFAAVLLAITFIITNSRTSTKS